MAHPEYDAILAVCKAAARALTPEELRNLSWFYKNSLKAEHASVGERPRHVKLEQFRQ